MTKVFRKNVSGRSKEIIEKEVRFQRKAAELGLSPKILDTDFETYIEMENLEQMCLADMYGESINDMPHLIKKGIYEILQRLYLECDIEYIDVTPYNFIETNDQLWIIDFGDAREAPKKNYFLKELFRNRELTVWNSDFY